MASQDNICGVIYILTNPSFPDYVKIGFTENIEERVKKLNNTECTPYAFRVYATYQVSSKLSDTKIHAIIDKLNPDLRAIDKYNGSVRVREFYAMSPEDAYSILEAIAEIHGFENRLTLVPPNEQEIEEEISAEQVEEESKRRMAPFSFSLCEIPVGAILNFYTKYSDNDNDNDHDSGIQCTVIDTKHVQYDGKIWSLSSLAAYLLNSKKKNVPGPRYFKYNGEWLNNIRKRLNKWM